MEELPCALRCDWFHPDQEIRDETAHRANGKTCHNPPDAAVQPLKDLHLTRKSHGFLQLLTLQAVAVPPSLSGLQHSSISLQMISS
jgi:hypothetical protein